MAIYMPKHFAPHELLDPQTFKTWGAVGLRYLDQGLLRALDWIWEHYPAKGGERKIVVNDYGFGGNKRWSGLRLPGSEYYRPYSAHAWGRAVDARPHGISMPEFAAWLGHHHAKAVKAEAEYMAALATGEEVDALEDHPLLAIRRMEDLQDAPTWAHLDTLETDSPNLTFVKRSA
jgi:hypothetical protein